MKNHEIPSEIWNLRNQIIGQVEKYMSNSNNLHSSYKNDMSSGARTIRDMCDKIILLVERYQQPKEV